MNDQVISEVRERLGRVFLRILFPLTTITALVLFFSRLLRNPLWGPLLVVSGLLISIIIGWILSAQKKFYKAGIVVSSAILFVAIIGTLINGGVTAPAYIGTLVPLTFFAWLTNKRVSYTLLVITLLIGLFTTFYPQLGIPESTISRSAINLWITYFCFFVLIVSTAVIGAQMLHDALKRSEEQRLFLETTFASLEDMVVVYTQEFNILKKNRKAEIFWADNTFEDDDFFSQQVILEDKSEISFKEFLQSQSGNFSNVKTIIKSKGKRFWCSLTSSEFSFSGLHKLLVIRDITTEVEQEYNLIQAQKMDAVGQLASGIAHDFNNMLSGILGASEILLTEARDDQKEMLNLISTATDKASKLTKELLVFSRKSPRASTAVNIHTIINETSFLLKRTIDKRITILKKLNADHALVVGDDTLIQSALMNMGINASHAMPDGGFLTFITSVKELDTLFCTHSEFEIQPGEYLSIEIIDTGTGMSSEVQRHIFEPFFTTKEVGKGTGLGMSAVYSMVVKHKGAISVYSEKGTGTSFHILLPLAEKSLETEKQASELITKGTGSVLVVDDEEFIRITTTELLRSFGYTVFSVKNGQEALDYLSENAVDLVILDMIMPLMNGRETFEKIIEMECSTKVVLSSGFSKEDDIKAMKEKGLFGFLHKPYQRVELSRIVADAMNS